MIQNWIFSDVGVISELCFESLLDADSHNSVFFVLVGGIPFVLILRRHPLACGFQNEVLVRKVLQTHFSQKRNLNGFRAAFSFS